jgi:hypothetical protein
VTNKKYLGKGFSETRLSRPYQQCPLSRAAIVIPGEGHEEIQAQKGQQRRRYDVCFRESADPE